MRTHSKAWRLLLVAVLGAAVLAGGCAPQMKKVGYIGGAALLLGGVAARMSAESDTPDELEDLGLILRKHYFGTAAVITGAIVVIAALASPSESKAPPSPAPLTPPMSPMSPTPPTPLLPTSPLPSPSTQPRSTSEPPPALQLPHQRTHSAAGRKLAIRP